jgi:hypothetical protein
MIENHELREDTSRDIAPEQIAYSNPRVGSLVGDVGAALNYIFASLYPNYIGTFADQASLPATANANDYAFISDDGDGKSAGYVFCTLDGVETWQKKYDVDWSVDSLLSSFISETHPLYVFINGRNGGQVIYGGIAAGQSLELNANSEDDSGEIITHNHLTPLADDYIDLGKVTNRFHDIFLNGELKDGVINLSLSNLKDAFDHTFYTNNPHQTDYDQLITKLGTVTLGGDVTGTIDLSSSGNKSSTIIVEDDSHSHTKITLPNFEYDVYSKVKAILQNNDGISFSSNDGAETVTPSQADIDTAEITDIDSPAVNKVLASNSAGNAWVQTALQVELTGDSSGVGSFSSSTGKVIVNVTNDNISVNNITGIDMSGETVLITAGNPATVTKISHGLQTGMSVYVDSTLASVVTPALSASYTVTVLNANNFTIPATVTVGGSAQMIVNNSQLLFDTTAQQFKLRREYAEISHTEISDLDLNDDHQQYARVGGRVGSQTIKGGQDDNENLILESTASAVKGLVKTKDHFAPSVDATYSGSWSGKDLGTSSLRFNDINMKGELKGARIENLTSTPASSGQNKGRLVYNTLEDKMFYDNGVILKPLSSSNITTILVTMSSETSKLVNLTSVLEAGKTTADYIWTMYDSTTSESYFPSIARTSSTSVTLTSEVPLTGTFALKGI